MGSLPTPTLLRAYERPQTTRLALLWPITCPQERLGRGRHAGSGASPSRTGEPSFAALCARYGLRPIRLVTMMNGSWQGYASCFCPAFPRVHDSSTEEPSGTESASRLDLFPVVARCISCSVRLAREGHGRCAERPTKPRLARKSKRPLVALTSKSSNEPRQKRTFIYWFGRAAEKASATSYVSSAAVSRSASRARIRANPAKASGMSWRGREWSAGVGISRPSAHTSSSISSRRWALCP